MLLMLLLSFSVHAGEIKLKDAPATSFRRLLAICESQDAKCSGFVCKMSVTALKCERVPGGVKGSCTFKCNGGDHMLTGDQALEVFKVVEKQKKMIETTESTEAFKDASVVCESSKTAVSGVCKIKHAKIK